MESHLFWFNDEQWAKIAPHLPRNQPGPCRNDDRLILSGIMQVLKVGCRWVLGWTAPDGIDCARMRSLQISNKGDRPWNRLAELAWTRRNIFSSFME